MILQKADILLWRPLRPREYLICWCLRSKYHHASLVSTLLSTDRLPYSLDQNLDFIPEDPVSVSSLVDKGYVFDVYRYAAPVSDYFLSRVESTFSRIQPLPYAYLQALKVPLGLSYLPKDHYPRKYLLCYDRYNRPVIRIYYEGYRQNRMVRYTKEYKSLTCSGAVALAYCLNGVDCCTQSGQSRIREPVLYLPEDFTRCSLFRFVGTLDKNTFDRGQENENCRTSSRLFVDLR